MLINPRILLLVPVAVSLSASTPESVPVLSPASNVPSVLPSESPVLSEIPQSTASWADIVDHIPVPDLSVTVEVPVSRPVVPGGKPPASTTSWTRCEEKTSTDCQHSSANTETYLAVACRRAAVAKICV